MSINKRVQMSGKRDLNPRPPPWQGGALPLSYSRMVATQYPWGMSSVYFFIATQ